MKLLRSLRVPIPIHVTAVLAIVVGSPAWAERDPIRLTHGPMLGQATAHSMAVWGRTSDPGQFTVHYGTDPQRLDQISTPATTTIEHDNTGVAKLTDLKSDTALLLPGLGQRTSPRLARQFSYSAQCRRYS